MADLDKVIDKVRKLLALGQSPNQHEAAAAVAKARELLAEYDLTMESVGNLASDKRTSIRHSVNLVSVTEGKPEGWKADVLKAVASDLDCHTACSYRIETTKSGRDRSVKDWNLIGFGHDVEAAGYAVSFLIHEIERLAQDYADQMWAEIKGYRDANGLTQGDAEAQYVQRTGRHPLKAKLHFIKAAAQAVVDKLESQAWDRKVAARRAADAAAAAGTANPHAIVLAKDAAIEDFINLERYGKTTAQINREHEERMARWRQQEDALAHPAPEIKPETAAQRRKREAQEAAERRRSERYWDAQARKEAREMADRDHAAYRAGTEAGSKLQIRKGIGGGRHTANLEG